LTGTTSLRNDTVAKELLRWAEVLRKGVSPAQLHFSSGARNNPTQAGMKWFSGTYTARFNR
jgi:hypothetical protein